MKSISYVVLSKGEPQTLSLLQHLFDNKDFNDSIILVCDGNEESLPPQYEFYAEIFYHKLGYSYAEHRNSVLPMLKTDYAMFLDADETLEVEVLKRLKSLLDLYNYPDLLIMPRINYVLGLENNMQMARKYGWHVTGQNIIAWDTGDYQTRFIKVGSGLKWIGNLHERIYPSAYHTSVIAPHSIHCAITHIKTLEVQIKGNEAYMKKYTVSENQGIH